MADPAPTLSGDSFKILHIEDDLGDAQLVRSLVAAAPMKNIQLHHVDRLHEALGFLRKHSVDLIFLDVELPDAVAIKFDLVALRRCSRAPIILTTGMAREDVAAALETHPSLGYQNKNEMTTESLTTLIGHHSDRTAASKSDTKKEDGLQLEALLNSMSDAVIVVDTKANAHWANEAGWALLERDWIDDLKRALNRSGAMPSGLVIDIANIRGSEATTPHEARIDNFRGADTDHLMIVTLRPLRD